MANPGIYFRPADILLPELKNLQVWSVIACDQFSSEPTYWKEAAKIAGNEPSTLQLVIPEAFLGSISVEEAITSRAEAMKQYLSSGLFGELLDSFVYVEREVTGGRIRRGLVGALDLEAYDFMPGAKSPIRASEETVLSRIPPRVRVRGIAALELPHVMVLIDDPEKTVVEPLAEQADGLPKLYDFDLMLGGGRIRGRQVAGPAAARVLRALDKLYRKEISIVVGDGNHSLAAAKTCWEEIRKDLTPSERERHPARFALVELNNVYGDGIVFEPIHRVVFTDRSGELLDQFRGKAAENGREVRWLAGKKSGVFRVPGESHGSMIAFVQEKIDAFVRDTGAKVDYIHDDAAVEKLAAEGAVGLFLPAMDKSELFSTVQERGAFPPKSFSIGHARDKRYYLECRKIR